MRMRKQRLLAGRLGQAGHEAAMVGDGRKGRRHIVHEQREIYAAERGMQKAHAVDEFVDVAGIDLYPHMHRKLSIVDYLRLWWATAGKDAAT